MDEIQEEIDLLSSVITNLHQYNELCDTCAPQQMAIVLQRTVDRLEALKRISDHPASVDENLPLPL